MKLNEVFEDKKAKKAAIIKWFADNKVWVGNTMVESHYFDPKAKQPKNIRLLNTAINDIDKLGVLNIHSTISTYSTSPPPFKFGEVSDMNISSLDIFDNWDISDLDILLMLEITLSESQYIDLMDIGNIIDRVKHIHELKLVYEAFQSDESELEVANLIPLCIKCASTDTIRTVSLEFYTQYNADALDLQVSIRKNIITAESNSLSRPTVQFGNVMDFQEWLIDNGMEDLT